MGEYAAMVRVIACIVAAASLFIGGCYHGKTSAELKAYHDSDKARAELADMLDRERTRAADLNQQVRALLDRPAAKDTIREIIRNNPSECVRPAAVSDGLRAEIAAANQAISASGGYGTMRADSSDRGK